MAGRLDEEIDVELIFQMDEDFMEPEAPAASSPGSSRSLDEELIFQMDEDFMKPEAPAFLHKQTCLKLEGILSNVAVAEEEVYEKALKYEGEVGTEKNRSSVKKRLMVRLREDGYNASMHTSSWVATREHPGGEYEYIVIVMEEEENGGSTRLIVDINFRSQFELARPTTTQTRLTNTLPHIFVGKEEKLKKIISIFCSAAEESSKEEGGLHFPPWRKTRYMQSKWFSCCNKESTFSEFHKRGEEEQKWSLTLAKSWIE